MSIAAGTKVFTRTGDVRRFLERMPTCIDHVYIADDGPDDGPDEERQRLYNRDWPFDLTAISLPFDAGLGAGRHHIVQELEEDYLVVCDADHVIPPTVTTLRDILEASPGYGGVGGALVEPDAGTLYVTAQFFKERDGTLVRGAFLDDPHLDVVDGHPVFCFDFLVQATMFRRECLEAYDWDPEYTIGKEHADFYVGHWKRTDWTFGICPEVIFEHHPGGDDEYDANRYDENKHAESERYFLNKWGYDADDRRGFHWVHGPPKSKWWQAERHPLWKQAIGLLVFGGPRELAGGLYNRYVDD